MTSHLDSNWTTDNKQQILSGVQTRNGIQLDEYSIHGIAHVHAYRKDGIFMQRRLLQRFTYKGIVANKKIDPPLSKKNQLHFKRHALAGIKYSACTIPPLRHFLTVSGSRK